MECARKAGIKLNFDRCIIKTKCFSFFGNLYTPEGVKLDPNVTGVFSSIVHWAHGIEDTNAQLRCIYLFIYFL